MIQGRKLELENDVHQASLSIAFGASNEEEEVEEEVEEEDEGFVRLPRSEEHIPCGTITYIMMEKIPNICTVRSYGLVPTRSRYCTIPMICY